MVQTSEQTKVQRLLKPALFVLLAAPLGWLGYLVYLETIQPGSGLGADPTEAIVHYLGEWSLRMVLVAFSVTPLRTLLKFSALGRARRMVGLFAFAYVSLHLSAYVVFYLQVSWAALLEDLVQRTYITAGMFAWVGLMLMALTSTRGWQRRLRRRWAQLHKVIYPVIALSLLHLWWLTKDGYTDLVIYSLWFGLLLLARYLPHQNRARTRTSLA